MRKLDTSPLITILMPVYNGAEHIEEATLSLLSQTFSNFELLIIDDGSTDNTLEILAAFGDPRIKITKNEINIGLIRTLNRGLELAQGKYIARMDHDDIAHPQRLAKQFAFMERNLEVGVCGTWYALISGAKRKIRKHPSSDRAIRDALLVEGSVICHPSVIIRRSVIESFDLRYDEKFLHAEDYRFWTQIAKVTNLANLPEVLLSYRSHESQISSKFRSAQQAQASRIKTNLLLDATQSLSADLAFLETFLNKPDKASMNEASRISTDLEKIFKINRERKLYSDKIFAKALIIPWSKLALASLRAAPFRGSISYFSATWLLKAHPFAFFRGYLKAIHTAFRKNSRE